VPGFDLFTLNVVTTANVFLAGVALLVVSRLNTTCHGLKRCVIACALLVAGFAFFPLRLAMPGNLMVILTNFPLFAGGMFLLDGVRAFRGLARPTRAYIAVSGAYVTLFCWFLFVHDSVDVRVAVGGLFMGAVALWTAVAMGSEVPPPDRRVYWATAAGFAVHGVSLLTRGVAPLFTSSVGFYRTTPVDFINIATLNIAALGCAFGMSMATSLQLQRRTEKLALYDSLTNLPNRRYFEERLEQAERQAFETGQRIALIYCDLDDFKGINDTLGHEGGDQALRTVADQLRGLANNDVFLARIGGDEFALLIERAPARESIEEMIDELRQGVEGEVRFGDNRARLRISCGLAIYPEDVGSTSDLIRLADAGMYMMKQRGRFKPVRQELPTGL
jgi:diguanylate cyclase (GGDEF)-like protein